MVQFKEIDPNINTRVVEMFDHLQWESVINEVTIFQRMKTAENEMMYIMETDLTYLN